MENEVFKSDDFRKKLYLYEFVTNQGKISVITYDLLTDKHGKLYFEYGHFYQKVAVDDFEEVEE